MLPRQTPWMLAGAEERHCICTSVTHLKLQVFTRTVREMSRDSENEGDPDIGPLRMLVWSSNR